MHSFKDTNNRRREIFNKDEAKKKEELKRIIDKIDELEGKLKQEKQVNKELREKIENKKTKQSKEEKKRFRFRTELS